MANERKLMTKEQHRNDWIKSHPSYIDPKPKRSAYVSWFQIVVWGLALLGAMVFSAVHSIPVAAKTMHAEGIITEAVVNVASLSVWLFLELAIFGSAFVLNTETNNNRKSNSRIYIVAILVISLITAIASNTYSSMSNFSIDADGLLYMIAIFTAFMFGNAAPMIAWLSGHVLSEILQADNHRYVTDSDSWKEQLKTVDERILASWRAYLKRRGLDTDFNEISVKENPPIEISGNFNEISVKETMGLKDLLKFLESNPEISEKFLAREMKGIELAELTGASTATVSRAFSQLSK